MLCVYYKSSYIKLYFHFIFCTFFLFFLFHSHFLFHSLSTKDIETRSESLSLFETLKCNPQAFYSHMAKYVLPTVEGTDLNRLLYYYTLLDAAGCEPYVTTTIKPDSHVKLLKKLRAVANGEVYTVFYCDYIVYVVHNWYFDCCSDKSPS